MIRIYHFTIDGARFQLNLRAALSGPIFELLGPKYTQSGPIFSALGVLDLDALHLHPHSNPDIPWAGLEDELKKQLLPELAAWEAACCL